MTWKRIPAHIGVIPDGNRRWAQGQGLEKKDGYEHGVYPGLELCERMLACGVGEASFFGFTKDNTKRSREQCEAFRKSCVDAVQVLQGKDMNVMVVGDADSDMFPDELRAYANKRIPGGQGLLNVNILVNYDWEWDLRHALKDGKIASHEVPRMDMVIRWGGRRRLSGFLPVQSVYSDIYIVEDYWPDYRPSHFEEAMRWYQDCDVTLGG